MKTETQIACGEKLFVVAFSYEQRQWHVESLAELCAINLRAFGQGVPTSFVPLALFASREEASAWRAKVETAGAGFPEGDPPALLHKVYALWHEEVVAFCKPHRAQRLAAVESLAA